MDMGANKPPENQGFWGFIPEVRSGALATSICTHVGAFEPLTAPLVISAQMQPIDS